MGPPKMPHNNRMSTSGALKTSAIWQKTIGHDPYAGNEVQEPEPSAADEAKAKQVLEVARQQNLTDGANRDDFAQKMYTGLKSGKRRRADLMNQVDPNKEKIMGILQEDTSSSEEEFVEVAAAKDSTAAAKAANAKEEKRGKGKREVKKKDSKRKKESRKRRDDDDDDSSSDDSSQRERDRSRRRRREKDKDKRKRKHRSSRHRDRDSDSNSDSSDDDDSSSDRDRKRKHSKRRKEKKRSRSDHDRRNKSSREKEGKNDKGKDDGKPKEEFVASAEFDGSKKGYSFRAGDRGVGYYVDDKPPVDKKMRDEMLKLYQE